MKTRWILLFLFFHTSWVYAQYKILQMQPPGSKKYYQSQLQRMDVVKKYKYSGAIGESDDGLLAIHDIKTLNKKEQETVQKTVASENKDRESIYKLVIKHNKLDAKEKKMFIESAFETYKNTDAKGTFFRQNNKWQQKF